MDIEELQLNHTNAPLVTGGYLLKIDRTDPDERTFYDSALQGSIVYQDPPGLEMVTAARAAQANYIQNYFSQFGTALWGANYTNTATGYAALPPKAHRATIDLDGLKFLNDKLGRKTVDSVLRAFGRLAMRFGGGEFDFAHLHGDEYAAQSDDLGALQKFVERVQSVSDKVRWRVTAQDGTVKELQGVQFGHGIGESDGAAERSLQDGKRARSGREFVQEL